MTLVEELYPIIQSVSRNVAREYPGVQADDIAQEVCVFVMKAGKGINPAEEKGTRYILYRAAKITAAGMRADSLYGTSQYNYRPEDVRPVLEVAFGDRLNWEHAPVPGDARSIKRSSDALDMVLDVLQAYKELESSDRGRIRSRYELGVVPERNSSELRALNRSVERLVDVMNTAKAERASSVSISGHPGSRRAMSNAQASAAINRQMDGE